MVMLTASLSSHHINKNLHSPLKPKRQVSISNSCKDKHGNEKVINTHICRQLKQVFEVSAASFGQDGAVSKARGLGRAV